MALPGVVQVRPILRRELLSRKPRTDFAAARHRGVGPAARQVRRSGRKWLERLRKGDTEKAPIWHR
jgi:hypothetical protein